MELGPAQHVPVMRTALRSGDKPNGGSRGWQEGQQELGTPSSEASRSCPCLWPIRPDFPGKRESGSFFTDACRRRSLDPWSSRLVVASWKLAPRGQGCVLGRDPGSHTCPVGRQKLLECSVRPDVTVWFLRQKLPPFLFLPCPALGWPPLKRPGLSRAQSVSMPWEQGEVQGPPWTTLAQEDHPRHRHVSWAAGGQWGQEPMGVPSGNTTLELLEESRAKGRVRAPAPALPAYHSGDTGPGTAQERGDVKGARGVTELAWPGRGGATWGCPVCGAA